MEDGDTDARTAGDHDGATCASGFEAGHLGRFEIVEALGTGGMGDVYRARDPKLGRDVAVKVLRAGRRPAFRAHAEARFVREAQAMARLSHPNVLPIYDVGVAESALFLAMELVEGQTLFQWIRSEQRAWREVLRCFVAAGRGLAAAHAAGIVHRDFKPSNVLIGSDGRICVTDFGIAKLADDGDGSSGQSAHATNVSDAPATAVATGDPLTEVGFVMGTARYMAPEHRRGEAVTAASDQYSFAVALHWALHGRFPGEDGDARAAHPAREVDSMPRAIGRALAQALRPEAGDRFASMDALLDRLHAAAGRTPRVAAWSVGLLAATALVGGALYGSAPDPCERVAQPIRDAWGPVHQRQLHAAFSRADPRGGVAAAEHVGGVLDAYAIQWQATREAVCAHGRETAELAEATQDARVSCLDRSRTRLAALVAQLVDADAAVVSRAAAAVLQLPPPTGCGAAQADGPGIARPAAAIADRVAELRDAIDGALAQQDAGRYDASRTALLEIVERVRALQYEPLLGEALRALGSAERALGRGPLAEATLSEAYFVAVRAGDPMTAAKAAAALAVLTGTELARPDDGRTWERHARAQLELAPAPLIECTLLAFAGLLAEEEGDLDQAFAHHTASLELARGPDGDPRLVEQAYNNLGNVAFRRGQLDEAAAAFRRTADERRRLYGPAHVLLGNSLNNLGVALKELGRYDESLAAYDEVEAIYSGALPPDHREFAGLWLNMAVVHGERGEGIEAIALLQRAARLQASTHGDDHMSLAGIHSNLGALEMELGRNAEARASYERAIRIVEAQRDETNPLLGEAVFNLALLDAKEGDGVSALQGYARAAAIFESTLGPDHRYFADVLDNAGVVDLSDEDCARAVRALESLAATHARHDRALPGRAPTDQMLARARTIAR